MLGNMAQQPMNAVVLDTVNEDQGVMRPDQNLELTQLIG